MILVLIGVGICVSLFLIFLTTRAQNITTSSPLDGLPQSSPPPSDPAAPDYGPQARELAAHVKAGRLIEAIALYRELYGCDLATAKDAVDTLAAAVRRNQA